MVFGKFQRLSYTYVYCCRYLSRFNCRRKIVNVLSPGEEEAFLNKKNRKTQLGLSAKHDVYDEAKVDSVNDEIIKLHVNDQRFGPAISRVKSRNQRYKSREILLEGHRLVRDALAAGAVMNTMYLCDRADAALFTGTQAKMYLVSRPHMKLWSDVVTPPGLMAIFEMPNEDCVLSRPSTIPVSLLCDNIRDPGNMGTLIRLAAAAQCDKVILPQGCVDVWEPKVLRSAMGCHFRVPLYSNLTWGSVVNHLNSDTTALLADISRTENFRILDSAMDQRAENTQTSSPRYSSEVMDILRGSERNDYDHESESSDSDDDVNNKARLYADIPINTVPYYDVDFTSRHHTIVVCNEAAGPSAEAKKLVYDKYGDCVTIPTDAGVESLNSAMAAAVILFEARRQLMIKIRNRKTS